MAYTVNWSVDGTNPAGKPAINVPDSTEVSDRCSIVLTGKKTSNYGEKQQENLIRILENFASPTEPHYATVGQLWYDTSSKALKICTAVGTDTPTATGNAVWSAAGVFRGPAAPSPAFYGQLWFNETDNQVYVYGMDNAWRCASTSAYNGLTAPSNPSKGQLWLSPTNNQVYVYIDASVGWRIVSNSAHTGTTPPVGVTAGQLWYDTNSGIGAKVKIYTGTDWLAFENPYASGTAPTVAEVGQLWYDTAQLILKVCQTSSTPGPAVWRTISGAYAASTAPVSPQIGALWYDTSVSQLKMWDGSAWVGITLETVAGTIDGGTY